MTLYEELVNEKRAAEARLANVQAKLSNPYVHFKHSLEIERRRCYEEIATLTARINAIREDDRCR